MLCLLVALATCDRIVKLRTESTSKNLMYKRMYISFCLVDDIAVSVMEGERALNEPTYFDRDMMNCI